MISMIFKTHKKYKWRVKNSNNCRTFYNFKKVTKNGVKRTLWCSKQPKKCNFRMEMGGDRISLVTNKMVKSTRRRIYICNFIFLCHFLSANRWSIHWLRESKLKELRVFWWNLYINFVLKEWFSPPSLLVSFVLQIDSIFLLEFEADDIVLECWPKDTLLILNFYNRMTNILKLCNFTIL